MKQWLWLLGMTMVMGLSSTAVSFEPDMDLALAPVAYRGIINYGYSGWSLSAGDVDKDGRTDFLIGGNRVYLVLGKTMGKALGDSVAAAASASFLPEASFEDFGHGVSMSGDVNNDGVDDILISAKRHDASRGKTYLILGKNQGWAMDTPILNAADTVFPGEHQGDWSGSSVCFTGDVNGDGMDDILIGAYMADAGGRVNAGRTYLFFGRETGWHAQMSLASADVIFDGPAQGMGSGRKVSPAGDVNGDGIDDLLIGAPGGQDNRGQVFVVLGRSGQWVSPFDLSSAHASFTGESVLDSAGSSLSAAGDVNGDGLGDFLIGADENDTGADRAGKAYLVFGRTSGWEGNTVLSSDHIASFTGEAAGDHLGACVGAAGDVNNDGFDDFLLGATWADQYAGKAYLVYGRDSDWGRNVSAGTLGASFLGEAGYDYAGFSFFPAGDINGDGNHDFLMGAPYFGSQYIGKTYLYFSDAPVFGDEDQDGDVDGQDLVSRIFSAAGMDLERFARGFGYVPEMGGL